MEIASRRAIKLLNSIPLSYKIPPIFGLSNSSKIKLGLFKVEYFWLLVLSLGNVLYTILITILVLKLVLNESPDVSKGRIFFFFILNIIGTVNSVYNILIYVDHKRLNWIAREIRKLI